MLIWIRYGASLEGVVYNAQNVFDVRTQFFVFYLPLLPMRSYVCVLEESRLTRRSRRRRMPTVPASVAGPPPVLEYSQEGRPKMRVAAMYPLPHNVWLSVLAGYMWNGGAALAVAATICAMIGTGAGSHLAQVIGLCALVPAVAMLLLPKSKAFARIDYEKAVRLAVRAHVPEAALHELQTRYGKSQEGRFIYGLPVSAARILYAYVDSELDNKMARRIADKIEGVAFARKWVFPEVWPIHTWTVAEDARTQRDLGIVLSLPARLPEDWQRDLATLITCLERIGKRHHVDFAVGLTDLRTGANHDLATVNGSATDIVFLTRAIQQAAVSTTAQAVAPRT